MILPMISYTYHTKSAVISECYDMTHDISAYNAWKGPLISVCYVIIAVWYHWFHDMLAYIMAPARRDGAGCGRQAPGAPPPPASPLPTCYGRVLQVSCTGQRPWSRAWTCSVAATSSLRWKFHGNFKLNVTTSLNLLSATLYWDINSSAAHVGQLVVAGLKH
jgi:hypothetical protein